MCLNLPGCMFNLRQVVEHGHYDYQHQNLFKLHVLVSV